jgi:molybdenum cofactor biosynthesis enzyme MoaA
VKISRTFNVTVLKIRRPEAGFSKVMSAIEAALDSGYSCESDIKTLKINCVVMRGLNEDEIADFVTFTKDKPGLIKILHNGSFLTSNYISWSNLKPCNYS